MEQTGITADTEKHEGREPLDSASRAELDVLRGILETSRDACWCIEYDEPVDMTAPEAEILRQFFENVSLWRLCNDAMAKLYKLPAGLDFNEQSVRFYFPRNGDNEDFVRQLIRAGFNMDNVPSVDKRHDGSVMHAQNDVRADIRDGNLYRLWGTVRDVSAFKRAEQELTRQLGAMQDVLTALPDPVLVIDGAGVVEAANPALEACLGFALDTLLGQHLDDLIDAEGGFAGLASRLRRLGGPLRCNVSMTTTAGLRLDAEMNLARSSDQDGGLRFVASLRLRDDGPAVAVMS
jgi:PAS domain-containing protein